MNDAILKTSNLTIGYKTSRRTTHVVGSDISVSLVTGELVCLLGANGAGKSTLLRTLAGIQPPISGKVTLLGDDVNLLAPQELAKRLSLVLTEKVDVGMLSAYALVAMGRYPYTDWWGRLTPKDEKIVNWAIESVGSLHLAKRNVGELSDGERQKIMIARALAQEPILMLLDEPTAFLDLPRRVEIMQLLRCLARETHQAILLSTHDLDLALRLADKIWLLSANGSLHIGAPEDLVLSGTFADTFRSEGVEFNSLSGEFCLNTPHKGKINVVGEGIEAVWTIRALQRVGFQVVENHPTPISVEVIAQRGQVVWQTKTSLAVNTHSSLYELIKFLDLLSLTLSF
jgi:iron complex transport system ATP-binding protein